jgi:hypothetical protein
LDACKSRVLWSKFESKDDVIWRDIEVRSTSVGFGYASVKLNLRFRGTLIKVLCFGMRIFAGT